MNTKTDLRASAAQALKVARFVPSGATRSALSAFASLALRKAALRRRN